MAAPCDEEPIPPQTGEGDEADSPAELDQRQWKAALKRAATEFKDDRGTLTAAGMAFYWFLAVFPGLLAAVGVLGLVNLGQDGADVVIRTVRSALPGDAADVLVRAVERASEQSAGSSAVAALFGLAVALWGASSGMVAMQMGLDVAYDVQQPRPFVKKRLVALSLVAVATVLGGVATALVVFGAPLGESLRDNLPFGSLFVVAWTVVRWVLAIGALSLMFACFYYLAPNRDSPAFVWFSPGGVVAALIWMAASLGFSFYVTSFASYAETYGSLTGVVVLLLWLYLSAIAVLLGGELNGELERASAEAAGEVKKAQSRPEQVPPRPKPGQVARPERWVAPSKSVPEDDDASRLAEAWQSAGRR